MLLVLPRRELGLFLTMIGDRETRVRIGLQTVERMGKILE
jgi:hypothetical protein